MNIVCPHCNFSKTVDPNKIPDRAVQVNCPKCSQGFSFDKTRVVTPATATEAVTQPPAQITCPACGLVQSDGPQCSGCGVIYSKLEKQQKRNGHTPQSNDIDFDNFAELRRKASVMTPLQQPKAGFWVRAIAYLIDSILLLTVQTILSLLIGLIIGLLGIAAGDDPAVNIVVGLFGVVLSFGYAVFFTGYCGQTPGKMVLRIKVIRTDGSSVTYGRAVLREVLGKFISSILLGIGYLMVAFDSQKQGLHDKIADTYVIKL